MTTYFNAPNFNGTADTNLEAFTDTLGHSLTPFSGTGTGKLDGTGGVYRSASSQPYVYAMTATDQRVVGGFKVLSLLTSDNFTVYARATAGTNTYLASISQAGVITLSQNISATGTTLATSAPQPLNAGETHTLTLIVTGGTVPVLTALFDGAAVTGLTNVSAVGPTYLTAAANAGLRPGGGGTATAQSKTSGLHPVSLVIDDAPATIPSNTSAPTITPTGTQNVGTVLTISVGAWTSTPTGYSVQLRRDGTAFGSPISITSGTTTTYQLANADQAHTIDATVVATNTVGSSSAVATSNQITVPSNAPTVTTPASITGTAQVGVQLTGSVAFSDGTPAYQWQISTDGSTGWTNITGATSTTYTPVTGDQGKYLRFTASSTNGSGTSPTSSSSATSAVLAAAAIDVSNIVVRYSGGTGNTTPSASTGGAEGGDVADTGANTVWGILPNNTAASSTATIYRGFYVHNTHLSSSMTLTVENVVTQLSTSGVTATLGAATEGVNTDLVQLTTQAPAPLGVTFATTNVSLGTIGPGQRKGFWIRLVISQGTGQINGDPFSFSITTQPA